MAKFLSFFLSDEKADEAQQKKRGRITPAPLKKECLA